jgi:hypothetical protein
MDAQVLVALIGAGGAVLAAIIGARAVLSGRPKPSALLPDSAALEPHDTVALGATFVDVSLVAGSQYWIEEPQPTLDSFERRARWYFRRPRQVEGSDLLLEATVVNSGPGPIIISRVGVELVAGLNVWGGGEYYGTAPTAQAIGLDGAYELRLPPSEKIRAFSERDPDEMAWYEIGETYGVSLTDPMYLEYGTPFRYTLNLKEYDHDMANHTIVRLWLRTSSGEVRSDDISIVFRR